MTEIEKTEGEIKVLQAKLQLLKEMENHKSPAEEAYKRFFGCYPDTGVSWNDENEICWFAFQVGYNASQKDYKVEDEPKPMDDVIDRLLEKYKSQKLWNILSNKYDYISATCDDIVSAVEEWLPKEQSAEGSQNVDVELLVDGFNDAIQKMKEKLR